MLKVPGAQLPERIAATLAKLKSVEKELDKLRKEQLAASAASLVGQAQDVAGIRLLAHNVGELNGADDLRNLALDLRTRLGSEPVTVAMTGVANGRPLILVATNEAARTAGVKAGALVKIAAGVLGGGGGGKDDVAQGGGSDAAKIDEALAAVTAAVANR
jgi:alanyl-tRNA synthetase